MRDRRFCCPLRHERVVLALTIQRDAQCQALWDTQSPALDVIELLRQKGTDVRYHDPYVPIVSHNGYEMQGEPDLDATLAAADCAVVVTDHSSYDWATIRQRVRLIVDTRHATEDWDIVAR